MALDGKTMAIMALLLMFAFAIFFGGRMSGFMGLSSTESSTPEGTSGPNPAAPVPTSEVPSTQTPSALLPNEIPVADNFGQFSAQDIIGNQNYLDPRNQIGYPGTVGGVLRNANLQYRSEPLNPRDPVSIFNLSTIVPDTMRPTFEIQDKEYQ
jgi:hypothetical protein